MLRRSLPAVTRPLRPGPARYASVERDGAQPDATLLVVGAATRKRVLGPKR